MRAAGMQHAKRRSVQDPLATHFPASFMYLSILSLLVRADSACAEEASFCFCGERVECNVVLMWGLRCVMHVGCGRMHAG